MKRISFAGAAIAVIACTCLLSQVADAQSKLTRIDRERAFSMLRNVRNKIKEEYYDPTFGGRDIDARFALAEEQLRSAATLGDAFSVIARAVMELDDSHTSFSPPSRNAIVDYGWKMRMYGERCLVTAVRERSDAAKKGLEVGDEVIAMNRFQPTRSELWKMVYYYQRLNPQSEVALLVRKPNGDMKELNVRSKVTMQKGVVNIWDHMDFNAGVRESRDIDAANRHVFAEVGAIKIWRMNSFAFHPRDVDRYTGQFRNNPALILDLRGNPGGYVVTLEKLAQRFFVEDTKIADLIGRKEMAPQMAKGSGDRAYRGKVVVLIDSSSGSAAEIFARLMQLEKRGVVLGDVSAGAVMQSRGYGMDAGSGTVVSYGMSITNADVIMSDGKSLEKVGVQPDERIIATGADLAAGRDPVMARALEILGMKMDAESAGKLLPKPIYLERKTLVTIYIDF